ncbi:uncharacterized protein LOC132710256 [Pantherophis guttatus]|uniref:Uncharacterized protein LOC117656110 n=1 Tax=Pantherophis guttatus TaxID=94885 RepID=A0A6P9ARC6_PANGU|nr:uncharacterized protein LOC117656110 [Pantherophis guttatus]XP_060541969.1 uncharacterized protein LOC132710256 [Pantherophis guttatus]
MSQFGHPSEGSCISHTPISNFNIGPCPSACHRLHDLHKTPGNHGCLSQANSHQSPLLFGRHPNSVVLTYSGYARPADGVSMPPTVRLFPEPGEKPSATHYSYSSSESHDRFREGSGLPVSGSVTQHNVLDISDSLPQVGASVSPISLARENDLMHLNSSVGSIPCLTIAMVPAPIPEVPSQQFQGPGTAPGRGSPVLPLVDLGGPMEGMHFPGTTTSHHYNGCELVGLGHPPALPCCSGSLVSCGSPERYQLAGAAGSPSCPVPLPLRRGRPPCANPDRQCDHESTCEPRGGHLVQITHG